MHRGAPFPDRLLLVACWNGVRRGQPPIPGALNLPGKGRVRRNVAQAPPGINGVVGCHPKLAARPNQAGELIQGVSVDKAPFGVTALWPRVWVEKKNPGEARVSEVGQKFPCVFSQDADVGETSLRPMAQETGDAVLEDFGANDAHIRMRLGLRGKVLSGPKTDLEPNVRHRRFK